jgi:hypothetical protein
LRADSESSGLLVVPHTTYLLLNAFVCAILFNKNLCLTNLPFWSNQHHVFPFAAMVFSVYDAK